MVEERNQYRQVIKATSIFGGIQFLNIIIAVIKWKAVAIFLGANGFGIIKLLNSTIELIGEFTKVGLDTSAVKEISFAEASKKENKIPIIVSSLRKMVWLTGTVGTIVVIFFSPILSKLAFGNTNYTIAFVWISITLLFKQLSVGQLAVLQGFRKLNYLAKAGLYGNLLSLIITLPLYYFFGKDAIVSVIILSSILSLLFSLYYSNRVKIKVIKVSFKEAFLQSKSMLRLGLMLSIQGLITITFAYSFQIFISHYGGLNELGFYSAGFLIINSYVNLIFNAMRADYFPRLSGVIEKLIDLRKTVEQQALIALLIITPIVILFLLIAPFIIKTLYSKDFSIIIWFVSWGILGTLFKAVSWSLGYVILAKGDSKLFIKTAIVFNSIFFILNVLGYYFGSLPGIGVSFLIYYCFHFISLKYITKLKYNVYLTKNFYNIFLISLLLCSISFLSLFIQNSLFKYSMLIILFFLSLLYSFKILNEKIDLRDLICNFRFKKNG